MSHESIRHTQAAAHHHHGHAENSQHHGGHHLLQVEGLTIGFTMYDLKSARFFRAKKEDVLLIKDLSLSVHSKEIVALVGASGSGKTLLADALMGMYEPNVTVEGSIWFDGALQSPDSLVALRGKEISLVPQNITHLDPLMKIGKQLFATVHGCEERKSRALRIHELLERYRLDAAILEQYPFELSGGMARRILLLMALLDEPKLLIADEPTPGLDLSLAVKAMDDFRAFADEGGGVLLITHDIELALKVADRVAVFKEGTIVEETAVDCFSSPHLLKHPFSRQLWHALPEHDFAINEFLVYAGDTDRNKLLHNIKDGMPVDTQGDYTK